MNELDTIEIKAGTKLRFPKVDKTGEVKEIKFGRLLGNWVTFVAVELSDGVRKDIPSHSLSRYFESGEAEIADD